MNTCWDTRRNTRPANNGSRIDYVLCSDGIKGWFTAADIQEGLMGSDHCPVYGVLADTVSVGRRERALLELMNPDGMFRGRERLRNWSTKDLLPLSAKLIPEFDRRQSIRDMFTKKPTPSLSHPDSVRTDTSKEAPGDQNSNTKVMPARFDTTSASPSTMDMGSLEVSKAVASVKESAQHTHSSSIGAKRTADSDDKASSRLSKKTKTHPSTNQTKDKVVPGQTTLKGFFKPKVAASKTHPSAQVATQAATPSPTKNSAASPSSTLSRGSPPRINNGDMHTDTPDRVFDPIEAKESWSRLLGKRVVPRCEHEEPCISLTTKKPGVNCGKSFATPVGGRRNRYVLRQVA